jgi:hypothetical protein
MHGSRRKPLKTFLPLAAAMLLAQAAHAECTSPNLNISGDFCKDCVYEGTMVVPRDQACQRLYRPSPANPVGSILSNRVVQRARHGIAGANGNTFAYMPTKGYAGADDFVVEVTYRQHDAVGKFRVHFSVTVQ